MKKFDELVQSLRELGLWVVPVGELEGFCRSIGSHGPAFVEAVLEQRNLETDAELSAAREFISQIWEKIRPKAVPAGQQEKKGAESEVNDGVA